jgi:hypothetical protein
MFPDLNNYKLVEMEGGCSVCHVNHPENGCRVSPKDRICAKYGIVWKKKSLTVDIEFKNGNLEMYKAGNIMVNLHSIVIEFNELTEIHGRKKPVRGVTLDMKKIREVKIAEYV